MAQSGCSLSTCPVSDSLYGYRPNLVVSVAFLAATCLCLVGTVAVALRTRRGASFTLVVGAAYVLEVANYAGRIASWRDPWDEQAYAASLVATTMAPVFLTLA